MPDKELDELKQIEVSIFAEFLNVCKLLNLRYYLLGGTLLGAIRHQGFIPWDDDIDIGMPRADYDILCEKGQALLPSHLFLQNVDTDPECVMCYTKIRDSNTTFLETSARKMNINHGVFIDIFPLDFYPQEKDRQKETEKKKRRYERRLSLCYYSPEKYTLEQRLRKLILLVAFPSRKTIICKREKLYRAVQKSDLLVNYGGAWGKKEIIPAEWYGEGTTVTFEGMKVTAPQHYQKWLTQVYGDYMKLPPEEKRITHHYTDMIDLTKSYREYMRKKT